MTTLLDMLVDFPILLPHKTDLIIPTHPESVPATVPQLATWLISARQRFQSKEISEEGTELLLASWRQKSSKSYDSLFGKWVDWCNQRHSDPVSGPINEVVNFVAHLFKEGYQYRSLNA